MSERINTPCPACGNSTLIVGGGGWLVCGLITGGDGKGGCPDPTMADRVLEERAKLSHRLREAKAFIAAHDPEAKS